MTAKMKKYTILLFFLIKASKKTPIIVLFKVRWEGRNEFHAENPGREGKAQTQQYHSSICKWKLIPHVKSFCCINVWQNSQFPGKSQYNFLLLPLLSPHMFLNVLGCCCKWDQQAQLQTGGRKALKQLKISPASLEAKIPWHIYFISFSPSSGVWREDKTARTFSSFQ